MFSGCLMIDCLRSSCLVKLRGFVHLAALGLVSKMLRGVVVKSVLYIIVMRKIDGFGETNFVPYVLSSS